MVTLSNYLEGSCRSKIDTHSHLCSASSYLSGQPTVSQNELHSGQNRTLSEQSFDYLMQLAGRFNSIFFKCFAGKLKSPDSKGIHLVDLTLSVWAERLARQPSGWLLSKILMEPSSCPWEHNTICTGHYKCIKK